MSVGLVLAVAFAIVFYRVADFENMSPLLWALASFALSMAISASGRGAGIIIVGQAGLFGLMWWYNAFRKRPR